MGHRAEIDVALPLLPFQLYGNIYDSQTLETLVVADEGSGTAASLNEEFVVGEKAFQRLLILHKLHHFKYTTFKRCMAKVRA